MNGGNHPVRVVGNIVMWLRPERLEQLVQRLTDRNQPARAQEIVFRLNALRMALKEFLE
jgi:hypothetical protein